MTDEIMSLPRLYKKDSKGNTRIYIIKMFDESFETYTGIVGKKLILRTHFPTPKRNYTLKEQVLSEAQSKWNKKYRRELYHTDKTFSTQHPYAYTQPMLAHDYSKVPHRVDWTKDWVSQPKLNGVRAIYKGGVFTSRKGKVYKIPHLSEALSLVTPTLKLDGELYIHDVELGDVTHAVANQDARLKYHIFDIASDTSVSFERRNKALQDLYKDGTLNHPSIQLVPIHQILEPSNLATNHDTYCTMGYEGAMLRDMDSPYEQGKRSLGLFKFKTFQDSEFLITNVKEDSDGSAVLVLITANGKKFNSRPTGTDAYRKKLLTNPPIGKYATVKYSELLASGIPEFNRTISVRDYE